MNGPQGMRQQEFDPLVARAQFQWTNNARAVSPLIECELVGPDRPLMGADAGRGGQARLELLGHIRAMTVEVDAIGFEEIKGRHIFVCKPADQFGVRETMFEGICPAFEDIVCGLIDACSLLQAVAATDADVATAHDGDSASVKMMIDNNDFCALIAGCYGGGKPGGASADDDDVNLSVPDDVLAGGRSWRTASHNSGDTRARSRSGAQKTTAAKDLVRLLLSIRFGFAGHWRLSQSEFIDGARSTRRTIHYLDVMCAKAASLTSLGHLSVSERNSP